MLWTEGPRRGAAWLGWRKVGKHSGSAEVGSPAAQESMLRAAPARGVAAAPRGTWSFPGRPLPACPAAEGRAWGEAGDPPPAGGTMEEFLSQGAGAQKAARTGDLPAAPGERKAALTARELIDAARGGGGEGGPAPPPPEEETMHVQDGCFVGAWGAWGACSYPCGGGVTTRTRRVFPPPGAFRRPVPAPGGGPRVQRRRLRAPRRRRPRLDAVSHVRRRVPVGRARRPSEEPGGGSRRENEKDNKSD